MNWRYKCDICGCCLDPGERLRCDGCRQEARKKIQQTNEFSRLLKDDQGQIQMRMEEMK